MLAEITRETEIPQLLRRGRAELGGGDATRFPQPRMAALLGVSLRQYQRWERGDSRPSAAGVERIRRILAERRAQAEESLVDRVESIQDEIRALRAELAALRRQPERPSVA